MTAGLPDMEKSMEVIRAQEEAGRDIIELGVPFSDPVSDGPVIQAASYKANTQGVTVTGVLDMVKQVRAKGCEIPIIFMMYYNTIFYYGLQRFVMDCALAGVDGLIIPDLPIEEQGDLKEQLTRCEDAPILIQLISPVSKERIPKILDGARGFVYCVSAMGVTGQQATFHEEVIHYLEEVKKVSKIPLMMGFGIRNAQDVEPMKDVIDGAIVGSHFITLMEENNYDLPVIKEYCSKMKEGLNLR